MQQRAKGPKKRQIDGPHWTESRQRSDCRDTNLVEPPAANRTSDMEQGVCLNKKTPAAERRQPRWQRQTRCSAAQQMFAKTL